MIDNNPLYRRVYFFSGDSEATDLIYNTFSSYLDDKEMTTHKTTRDAFSKTVHEVCNISYCIDSILFQLIKPTYGSVILITNTCTDKGNFMKVNGDRLLQDVNSLAHRLAKENNYTLVDNCRDGAPFTYTFVKDYISNVKLIEV